MVAPALLEWNLYFCRMDGGEDQRLTPNKTDLQDPTKKMRENYNSRGRIIRHIIGCSRCAAPEFVKEWW